MLEQVTADELIRCDKEIIEKDIIFPKQNDILILNLICINSSEKLLLDINRKGTFKLTRCTYQNRYQTNAQLVRLDIDTKPHRNPDHEVISPTHIHIYKEGYGDSWAYPLNNIPDMEYNIFTNTSNLVETFMDFCMFCNISKIPSIQGVL